MSCSWIAGETKPGAYRHPSGSEGPLSNRANWSSTQTIRSGVDPGITLRGAGRKRRFVESAGAPPVQIAKAAQVPTSSVREFSTRPEVRSSRRSGRPLPRLGLSLNDKPRPCAFITVAETPRPSAFAISSVETLRAMLFSLAMSSAVHGRLFTSWTPQGTASAAGSCR